MRALKIFSTAMLAVLLVVPCCLSSGGKLAAARHELRAPPQRPDGRNPNTTLQAFLCRKREELAFSEFQYEQLVSTLREAERYYPKTIPPMTHVDEIAISLSKAIEAKNEAKFDQAFDELSAGCNRCHMAADRAFIVIRRPSYPSAFSNQQYSPRPSGQQKQGQ